MELDELVALVKKTQADKALDITSLVSLAGIVSVKINTVQNLSGKEKMAVVCKVLKKALAEVEAKECAEAGKSEEDVAALKQRFADLQKAVDDVVPASLELALSAARGSLDLKKVDPSFLARLLSCFCRSAVTALASQNLISEVQANQATRVVGEVEKRLPSRRQSEAPSQATESESVTTRKPEVA